MPAPVHRGFVDSPAGQIHYVTTGAGKPVIFLHPSPFSWNYFADAAPLVANAGLQFIGMDTMGYGDSERPDPPFETIGQFAQAVVALMDGLGLEQAAVAGHQTGSVIAHEVGAGWPERVQALVLSEVFNWNTPARRALHEQRHVVFPPAADGSHLLRIWDRHAAYALEVGGVPLAERFFFNQYRVNRGDQPAAYGPMGWDGAAPWAMCRYELWDRSALIAAPTLILHGTKSDLRRVQERLTQIVRRSRAALYDSKSIGGPLDNLAGWTGAVVDFVTNPDV